MGHLDTFTGVVGSDGAGRPVTLDGITHGTTSERDDHSGSRAVTGQIFTTSA